LVAARYSALIVSQVSLMNDVVACQALDNADVVACQAEETADVVACQALDTACVVACQALESQPWPDGSVPVIGLSLTKANGLAAAEFGTGFWATVSLFMNWPLPGLYQRAAMLTLPLAGSVQPDS
jgi:hypothetical protein